MRRFWSYGPINPKLHYYAPRKELIERACTQLTGENFQKDGNYITVWAPRQGGKTWVMQEVIEKIKQTGTFLFPCQPVKCTEEKNFCVLYCVMGKNILKYRYHEYKGY